MKINPYESPPIAAELAGDTSTPWLVTYVQSITAGILMCVLLDVVAHAIHAWYCPELYRVLLHWDLDDASIWNMAIYQGAYEGLVLGTPLAALFVITAGRIVRRPITFREMAVRLLAIAAGAIGAALLLSNVGVLLFDSSYGEHIFPQQLVESAVMRKFARVLGSGIGLQLGAVLLAILNLVGIYLQERRIKNQTVAAK